MASCDTEIISEILSWLSAHSPSELATDPALTPKLTTLKELSRDKLHAQVIYTQEGIHTICKYSFTPVYRFCDWSMEAKRCLANALTLEPRCAIYFIQCHAIDQMWGGSNVDFGAWDFDAQFLYSRIMFLVTGRVGAETKIDDSAVRANLECALAVWFDCHQKWLLEGKPDAENPLLNARVTAWCELLKLLHCFSVYDQEGFHAAFAPINKGPDNAYTTNERNHSVILSLIHTLHKSPIDSLQRLIPHFVNILSNFENGLDEGAAIKSCKVDAYDTLLDILGEFVPAALDDVPWHGLKISEDQLAPLLMALTSSIETCTELTQKAKCNSTALGLFVPVEERNVALGHSQSMPSRLLQLYNSSSATIRNCIGTMLYVASGRNASRYIENVGYGHAIGFLVSNNIKIDPSDIPAEYRGQTINPVTGQNTADEEAELAQQELREMTDEEKEREAERLFVLFQRLKKTGVIDVEDPIQRAVNEGRFQEL